MNNTAIFIPMFNEEFRFRVDDYIDFIKDKKNKIDFYFLDDGSTDGTEDIIKKYFLIESNVYLLSNESNIGKGKVLRKYILEVFESRKKYIFYGFLDADLQISLNNLNEINLKIESENYLICMASRSALNKKNVSFRGMGSKLIVYAANRLLNFEKPINDTQCGCKIFHHSIIPSCFNDKFVSSWLFDIEILLRYKKAKFERNRIAEFQLSQIVEPLGGSKLRLSASIKILKELIIINQKYAK